MNWSGLIRSGLAVSIFWAGMFFAGLAQATSNPFKQPWPAAKEKQHSPEVVSTPGAAFSFYIRVFQKFISPVDGVRCQFYPTCSEYGRQSVQAHGAVLGFFMSADRLIRDNAGVPERYPLIVKFGRLHYYDPVAANDFWFTGKAYPSGLPR